MTDRVLILGASGKIGSHSARAFKEAGWKVRLFDRKTDDMATAAMNCDVIVNGLNPPNYHDWKTQIPKITHDVINAATKSGAAVLVPGNVYHFGNSAGVWSENTPPNPVSRKGKIRLDMEREYAASGVKTIILRAGNFIDPDGQNCPMSAVYLRAIKRGKITLPGPANINQAMCYLPDWSRAAVALCEKRDQLEKFEDIPFTGHTLTALDIKAELEQLLNKDLQFVEFPWWLFKLLGPFWELAREMNEMRYLWNTDHALSNERFNALVPNFKVTALNEVMRSALPSDLV